MLSQVRAKRPSKTLADASSRVEDPNDQDFSRPGPDAIERPELLTLGLLINVLLPVRLPLPWF